MGISLILLINLSHSIAAPSNDAKVISADEVKWGYLNPLRGDQGPAAADLWGDRSQSGATGMLVKLKDGFSSPPHIHNVSYRGIVIKGLLHNDDPTAEKMWLSETSFWTQPAGESHITAAGATDNIAYVEIDSGPYLVHPASEAFDNGEKPINVDSTNMVWINTAELNGVNYKVSEPKPDSPHVAFLWKQQNMSGSMLKLPPGFAGSIISSDGMFRAVVIQGEVTHENSVAAKQLKPGSYFESNGDYIHKVSTLNNDQDTIIYIRNSGHYKITN